jgi:hypothetical protein
MPVHRKFLFVLTVLCGLTIAAHGQSGLVMRGGIKPPPGEVTAVGTQGVTLSQLAAPVTTGKGASAKPVSAATLVLSWDRVQSVTGALGENAAAYMPVAEKVWRARSRLDRGDLVAAEPLFEELFATYGSQRGPTSAVVAAGLLRCRLGMGAQTAAVAPWLAYLNAVGDADAAGIVAPEADPSAGPVIDAATGLAPSLPPVWVNLPSVQSLARGPWVTSGPDTRPHAAMLGTLYEQAARFEAGLPVNVPSVATDHDDGVALVRDIVVARIGDESQRPAARQALMQRLKKRPAPWMEAWIRVGIGRSLLVEGSHDSQLLGVSELVELPARLERVNPYLTGIALADSAVAMARLGDSAGATRLRNELLDRFPGHPALEWEPLRGWTAPPPANVAPTSNPTPPTPPAPAADPDQPKGGQP